MTGIADLDAFDRSLNLIQTYRETNEHQVALRRYLDRANGTNPRALSDAGIAALQDLAGGDLVDDGSLPVTGFRATKGLDFCRGLIRNTRFCNERSRLPKKSEDEWVYTRRKRESAGRLQEAEKRALDQLLPGWNLIEPVPTFEECLARNIDFLDKHGRLPNAGEDAWLSNQRGRAKRGKLTDAEHKQLDASIPLWDQPFERVFLDRLREAELFVTQHGQLPNKQENPWLSEQRSLDGAGKLSENRRSALDKRIPGWRQDRETWFNEGLDKLRCFIEDHGRLPTGKENTWLRDQRRKYCSGKLSDHRRDALDQVAPQWALGHEAKTMRKMRELSDFYNKHFRLPTFAEDPWIHRMRSNAKKGKIDETTRAMLDAFFTNWEKDQTKETWKMREQTEEDIWLTQEAEEELAQRRERISDEELEKMYQEFFAMA